MYLPEAPSIKNYTNPWLALSLSLGSTMEIAFGTLKASISPVSVDQRNASTRLRPSPWSRADWLGWRLVQNRELTVGWPCWETLKTLTHGAFGLTSSVSHVHIGNGNTSWGVYHVKNSVLDAWFFFSTWNVIVLSKLATLKLIFSPMIEDMGLNIFLNCVGIMKTEGLWFCTYSVYCISQCPFALTYEVCAFGLCSHLTIIHNVFSVVPTNAMHFYTVQ